MQRATNAAYEEVVAKYKAGRLDKSLSREVAIGNYVDREVRTKLNIFFNSQNISKDPESAIRVNRRAYISSNTPATFRLPDTRVGDLAFDELLEEKQPSKSQIKDSSVQISSLRRW
jgi:hypothetical protein